MRQQSIHTQSVLFAYQQVVVFGLNKTSSSQRSIERESRTGQQDVLALVAENIDAHFKSARAAVRQNDIAGCQGCCRVAVGLSNGSASSQST